MIQNLVPDDPAHLKTLFASHRVYDHIAMYSNEMLAIEDRVLVLAGRIDNLYSEILVLVPNDFAECILNGRVVGVDKVVVDKLDCQRTLACSSVRPAELWWRGGWLLRTDRPATDNSHLTLLLLRRHSCQSMRSTSEENQARHASER